MDERVITKTIRTQLTDHQMAEIAREAAAKQQLITAMESDLQAMTKARKADIAKIQAEFDGLIKLAGDACTEEEMEVIERFDLARGVAIWIHPRTLEHLGERELTGQERGGPIGTYCAPAAAGEAPAAEEPRRGLILLDTDPPEAVDGAEPDATEQVSSPDAPEAHPSSTETTEGDGGVAPSSPEVPQEPKMPPEEPEEKPRKARARKLASEPAAPRQNLDARDNGYTPPRGSDTLMCRCGHASGVHGTDGHGRLTGCMVGGCGCTRFIEPDPLGLDGWVPPGERTEVSDAKA